MDVSVPNCPCLPGMCTVIFTDMHSTLDEIYHDNRSAGFLGVYVGMMAYLSVMCAQVTRP